MNKQTQVLVIGAGPAGYPAAFHAADLGLQVTLVDPEMNPGGVCLYRGCIPSKALLHVAKLLNEAREAPAWGVTFGEPQIDLDQLREWKRSVVQKLTGGLGQLSKQRNIEYIQGRAILTGSNSATITGGNGSTADITFDHAILATGSLPSSVPGIEISDRIMDSREALKLAAVPPKLLVVGGGYIGLELGQVYASLGSEVSVVEMMSNLLPGADKDLVRPLTQRLKKQCSQLMLKTKVVNVKETTDGVTVTFEDAKGEKTQDTFDKLLVAVGRKPVTDGLGLENTAVVVDQEGFVETDLQRCTAEPSIFAIGDIAGQPMLAHKGTYEAKVAAEAIAGKKTTFDAEAIPAVVFTDPEIAWCGTTETQAKEEGLAFKVSKFPWGASGRATAIGRNDGVTKIIADEKSDRVLGVGIAGPGAGELIGQGVLAIEMGATVEDIALSVQAHPTLSETLMEAAEGFHGHATHFFGR